MSRDSFPHLGLDAVPQYRVTRYDLDRYFERGAIAGFAVGLVVGSLGMAVIWAFHG